MKIQSYNHQKRVHFNLIDLNLGTSPKSVAKKLKKIPSVKFLVIFIGKMWFCKYIICYIDQHNPITIHKSGAGISLSPETLRNACGVQVKNLQHV